MLAAHVVLAAATKAKTTSSSSIDTLLLLVVVFGVVYFVFLRPRSQRAKQAREQLRTSEIGDQIVTIGGLVGTIVAENGDQVTLSTGNGTELVFLRQAIGRKLEPSVATSPDAADEAKEFEGPPPGFDQHPDPEPDSSGTP